MARSMLPTEAAEFQETVRTFYARHGRNLPWRKRRDPYRILVSEIMLQQTQVARVEQKYPVFVGKFPDFDALAKARLKDVLATWQGLGYNRRALALKKTAEIVQEQYQGALPSSEEALIGLPGIGPATAGAVVAFAFNKPAVFLETNIRTVFICHFFPDESARVKDTDLLPLVKQTLDVDRPRDWYYALMDYGVFLKKRYKNPGSKSAHYVRQSQFKGSNRELRGQILRALITDDSLTATQLIRTLEVPRSRLMAVLEQLQAEGLITKKRRSYLIA